MPTEALDTIPFGKIKEEASNTIVKLCAVVSCTWLFVSCRLTMKEDFYSVVMKDARPTSVSSESYSGRGWMSTSMMRWV